MTKGAPAQRLVLASASQHRRRLLQAAGVVFDVVPAAVDEAASKRILLSTGADAPTIAVSLAAEMAAGRHPEVSIAISPSPEGGTLQVLLDGQEIFNRKSLPTDGSAVPDPKLLKNCLLYTSDAADE